MRRGKRRHKKDKVRMKGGRWRRNNFILNNFNTVSYCTLFCREKHTAGNITWRPLEVFISCHLLLKTRKRKLLMFAVPGTAVYNHINKYRKILSAMF